MVPAAPPLRSTAGGASTLTCAVVLVSSAPGVPVWPWSLMSTVICCEVAVVYWRLLPVM